MEKTNYTAERLVQLALDRTNELANLGLTVMEGATFLAIELGRLIRQAPTEGMRRMIFEVIVDSLKPYLTTKPGKP